MENLKIATQSKIELLDNNTVAIMPERIALGINDMNNSIFFDFLSNKSIETKINFEDLENQKIIISNITSFDKIKEKYNTEEIQKLFARYFKEKQNEIIIFDKYANFKRVTKVEYENIKAKYTLVTAKSLVEKKDLADEANQNKLSKISKTIKRAQERIMGQDSQIKEVITAIYKNKIFNDPKSKSNILIYGPSGCGKTELIKTIGDILTIPVTIEDCTRFTSIGYVGSSVEDMLKRIFYNCDEDIEKAEQSILVLDEIDKKAGTDPRDDFRKADVLKSLLKVIEGTTYDITLNDKSTINFDTSNLTVICCGAFIGLEETKKTTKMGFSSSEQTPKNNFPKIEPSQLDKLISYGMPLEFIGRINTVVKFNALKKEDLVTILKESTLSPIRNYEIRINELGIKVNFNDNIYNSIADKAIELKTGARSLKHIVDGIFNDILYEVFDDEDREIQEIKLQPRCTQDCNSYQLVRKKY